MSITGSQSAGPVAAAGNKPVRVPMSIMYDNIEPV